MKKPIVLRGGKMTSMPEVRFQRLVENMNEAVWMGDANERTIYANPKFCKIIEYTLEEMLGRESYAFWTPESAERVHNVNITDRKGGFSSSYEGDLVTKSGKKIPVLLSGTPLPDGGTIGIMTDLTELKKKEMALKESEKKFRELADFLPQVVFEMDAEGKITFTNRNGYAIFGYSRDDVCQGVSAFRMLVPQDRERAKKNMEIQFRTGETRSEEYTALRKDGTIFPIAIHASPIFSQGRPVGLRGILIDMTQAKAAEEAIRQSESLYRTIFENTGTSTIIIGENKKIILANSEFEKMSGYNKSQIEGKKEWVDFFDRRDVSRLKKFHVLRRKNPESAPRNYETRFINRKGEVRDVYMTVALIPGTKNSVASLLDITERKCAEELLRSSEERYRSMIDQSMVGVCMFQGTKIVFSNQKIADIFGYKNGYDLVGKEIGKFLTSGSRQIAQKLTLLRQEGRDLPELGEYVGVRKNGQKIHLQTFSKRIVIGDEIYSQVLVVDATEKKQMQRKLDQRMKELDVMYRAQSHMLMICPLKDVLIDIAHDIVHALEHRELAYAQIIFDGKKYKSCRYSTRFACKIEEPFIVRGVKRGVLQVGYTQKPPSSSRDPFSSEERQVVGSVMRLLNKHIHNREIIGRYQKIVSKSIAGIYIAEQSIIRYVNPSFCKIFGVSEKEVLGKPLRRFVPGYRCNENMLVSPKSSLHCEIQGRKKNGATIDLDIITQKLDYHGRPGTIGRIHDITKIKAAEARIRNFNTELQATVKEKTLHLEQANKRLQSLNDLKDEFIAVTSHELRSPLTSIRGYLSFLMEKETLESLPSESRQFLSRAYSNTENLNHLVNNILDVSRLETGRFEIRKISTNLIKLVQNVMEGLAFQTDEKKLKMIFRNTSQKACLIVQADPVRLSQVIRNLLDNAIKFTLPGRSITVEIACKNSYITLKVIDQGVGIPKAKIGLLFGKFMQIKDVDTRYKGGAGLGLFISRHIVELHGGKITVESGKQKGSIFTIRLPYS